MLEKSVPVVGSSSTVSSGVCSSSRSGWSLQFGSSQPCFLPANCSLAPGTNFPVRKKEIRRVFQDLSRYTLIRVPRNHNTTMYSSVCIFLKFFRRNCVSQGITRWPGYANEPASDPLTIRHLCQTFQIPHPFPEVKSKYTNVWSLPFAGLERRSPIETLPSRVIPCIT